MAQWREFSRGPLVHTALEPLLLALLKTPHQGANKELRQWVMERCVCVCVEHICVCKYCKCSPVQQCQPPRVCCCIYTDWSSGCPAWGHRCTGQSSPPKHRHINMKAGIRWKKPQTKTIHRFLFWDTVYGPWQSSTTASYSQFRSWFTMKRAETWD